MRAMLLFLVLALALASAEDGVKVMDAHEVGAVQHMDVGEGLSKEPDTEAGKAVPKGDPAPARIAVPASTVADTLAARRKKRLTHEAYSLNKKYEYAKALKGKADRDLNHVRAKLSQAGTKVEENKAARLAAKKEQRDWKLKSDNAHMAMINARDELAAVKKQEKKAAAYVDAAKMLSRVASADGGTSGGGSENLERSERRRDESNDEAKTAKAQLVARQLAYGKIEAAVQAAHNDVNAKELAFESTRESLHESDHRFATAKYNIRNGKKSQVRLEIDLAAAQSHDDDMQRGMHVSHGLAHGASLVAKNDPSGDEVQIKALLEDSADGGDMEEKEAIGSAKDHDGMSDDGKPLVSAPGSIAADYKRRFAALPLPDNGQNPILEAEARAESQP